MFYIWQYRETDAGNTYVKNLIKDLVNEHLEFTFISGDKHLPSMFKNDKILMIDVPDSIRYQYRDFDIEQPFDPTSLAAFGAYERRGGTLFNKTVLVIGQGMIGRRLANMLIDIYHANVIAINSSFDFDYMIDNEILSKLNIDVVFNCASRHFTPTVESYLLDNFTIVDVGYCFNKGENVIHTGSRTREVIIESVKNML